uniref:Sushi domain-containing protein n=1 Tax=Chromera velia CCMP2878 TaxID=1169474 RepID=A0A0G4HUA4_9ALVE|eukprot:Cvel_1368.t1-p1 / transcript=Cvel_1368.t1 / gene=Cvel_1368 / organism=Chromera_velia_CCMP2878 / gene_product=hypothetical protein / transcript_product=hypothetical protein / location=Cvel_scaffold47:80177-104234(-) / protein_length=3279 / sequence_SO=supercontig / SO=protein_coding / is_pseudo=false
MHGFVNKKCRDSHPSVTKEGTTSSPFDDAHRQAEELENEDKHPNHSVRSSAHKNCRQILAMLFPPVSFSRTRGTESSSSSSVEEATHAAEGANVEEKDSEVCQLAPFRFVARHSSKASEGGGGKTVEIDFSGRVVRWDAEEGDVALEATGHQRPTKGWGLFFNGGSGFEGTDGPALHLSAQCPLLPEAAGTGVTIYVAFSFVNSLPSDPGASSAGASGRRFTLFDNGRGVSFAVAPSEDPQTRNQVSVGLFWGPDIGQRVSVETCSGSAAVFALRLLRTGDQASVHLFKEAVNGEAMSIGPVGLQLSDSDALALLSQAGRWSVGCDANGKQCFRGRTAVCGNGKVEDGEDCDFRLPVKGRAIDRTVSELGAPSCSCDCTFFCPQWEQFADESGWVSERGFEISEGLTTKGRARGDVRTVSCQNGKSTDVPGFEEETVKCLEAGKWSDPRLVCKDDCAAAFVAPEGMAVAGDVSTRRHLTTVTVLCDGKSSTAAGVERRAHNVTCVDGVWGDPSLKCYGKCPEYPDEGHQGYMVGGRGEKGFMEQGDTVTVECSIGFHNASGETPQTITCEDGAFSPRTLDCQRLYLHGAFVFLRGGGPDTDCRMPEVPSGAYRLIETSLGPEGPPKDLVRHGDWMDVGCAEGFGSVSREVKERLWCLRGEWTDRLMECIPDCPSQEHFPFSILNERTGGAYSISFEGSKHGDESVVSCSDGFSPGATLMAAAEEMRRERVRCMAGSFELSEFECFRDCPPFVLDDEKAMVIEGGEGTGDFHGASRTIACAHGYSGVRGGASKAQTFCVEGKWTAVTLSCASLCIDRQAQKRWKNRIRGTQSALFEFLLRFGGCVCLCTTSLSSPLYLSPSALLLLSRFCPLSSRPPVYESVSLSMSLPVGLPVQKFTLWKLNAAECNTRFVTEELCKLNTWSSQCEGDFDFAWKGAQGKGNETRQIPQSIPAGSPVYLQCNPRDATTPVDGSRNEQQELRCIGDVEDEPSKQWAMVTLGCASECLRSDLALGPSYVIRMRTPESGMQQWLRPNEYSSPVLPHGSEVEVRCAKGEGAEGQGDGDQGSSGPSDEERAMEDIGGENGEPAETGGEREENEKEKEAERVKAALDEAEKEEEEEAASFIQVADQKVQVMQASSQGKRKTEHKKVSDDSWRSSQFIKVSDILHGKAHNDTGASGQEAETETPSTDGTSPSTETEKITETEAPSPTPSPSPSPAPLEQHLSEESAYADGWEVGGPVEVLKCDRGRFTPRTLRCAESCSREMLPDVRDGYEVRFDETHPGVDNSTAVSLQYSHGARWIFECKGATLEGHEEPGWSAVPLAPREGTNETETEEEREAENGEAPSERAQYVTCNNGRFTALTLLCMKDCGKFPAPDIKRYVTKGVLAADRPKEIAKEQSGGKNDTETEGEEGEETKGESENAVARLPSRHGDAVRVSCKEGLSPAVGTNRTSDLLTCYDGSWTPQTMRCAKACPEFRISGEDHKLRRYKIKNLPGSLPYPQRGSTAAAEGGNGNDTVVMVPDGTERLLECNDVNFHLPVTPRDRDTVRCVDGKWTRPSLVCRRSCDPLRVAPNVTASLDTFFPPYGFCVWNKWKKRCTREDTDYPRLRHHTSVDIACADGHSPVAGASPSRVKCVDGAYSTIWLLCAPSCDKYKIPLTASMKIVGFEKPSLPSIDEDEQMGGTGESTGPDYMTALKKGGPEWVKGKASEEQEIQGRAPTPPPQPNLELLNEEESREQTEEEGTGASFLEIQMTKKDQQGEGQHDGKEDRVVPAETPPDSDGASDNPLMALLPRVNLSEPVKSLKVEYAESAQEQQQNEMKYGKNAPVNDLFMEDPDDFFDPPMPEQDNFLKVTMDDNLTFIVPPINMTGMTPTRNLLGPRDLDAITDLSKIPTGHGTKVEIACRDDWAPLPGTDVQGTQRDSVQCVWGAWSKRTLQCRKRCDMQHPRQMMNSLKRSALYAVNEYEHSYLPGGYFDVECKKGVSTAFPPRWDGSEGERIYCNDGFFSMMTISCKKSCGAHPLSTQTAKYKTTNEYGNNEHGSILRIECQPGFSSSIPEKTNETVSCVDGMWTASAIRCLRYETHVQCAAGYAPGISGTAPKVTITCNDGLFSSAGIFCYKVCMKPVEATLKGHVERYKIEPLVVSNASDPYFKERRKHLRTLELSDPQKTAMLLKESVGNYTLPDVHGTRYNISCAKGFHHSGYPLDFHEPLECNEGTFGTPLIHCMRDCPQLEEDPLTDFLLGEEYKVEALPPIMQTLTVHEGTEEMFEGNQELNEEVAERKWKEQEEERRKAKMGGQFDALAPPATDTGKTHDDEIECVDGRWVGQEMLCRKMCPEFVHPTNLEPGSSPYKVFKPRGPPVSPKGLQPKEGRRSIPSPLDAVRQERKTETKIVAHGTQRLIGCAPGYFPKAEKGLEYDEHDELWDVIECQDGRWNGLKIVCERECTEPFANVLFRMCFNFHARMHTSPCELYQAYGFHNRVACAMTLCKDEDNVTEPIEEEPPEEEEYGDENEEEEAIAEHELYQKNHGDKEGEEGEFEDENEGGLREEQAQQEMMHEGEGGQGQQEGMGGGEGEMQGSQTGVASSEGGQTAPAEGTEGQQGVEGGAFIQTGENSKATKALSKSKVASKAKKGQNKAATKTKTKAASKGKSKAKRASMQARCPPDLFPEPSDKIRLFEPDEVNFPGALIETRQHSVHTEKAVKGHAQASIKSKAKGKRKGKGKGQGKKSRGKGKKDDPEEEEDFSDLPSSEDSETGGEGGGEEEDFSDLPSSDGGEEEEEQEVDDLSDLPSSEDGDGEGDEEVDPGEIPSSDVENNKPEEEEGGTGCIKRYTQGVSNSPYIILRTVAREDRARFKDVEERTTRKLLRWAVKPGDTHVVTCNQWLGYGPVYRQTESIDVDNSVVDDVALVTCRDGRWTDIPFTCDVGCRGAFDLYAGQNPAIWASVFTPDPQYAKCNNKGVISYGKGGMKIDKEKMENDRKMMGNRQVTGPLAKGSYFRHIVDERDALGRADMTPCPLLEETIETRTVREYFDAADEGNPIKGTSLPYKWPLGLHWAIWGPGCCDPGNCWRGMADAKTKGCKRKVYGRGTWVAFEVLDPLGGGRRTDDREVFYSTCNAGGTFMRPEIMFVASGDSQEINPYVSYRMDSESDRAMKCSGFSTPEIPMRYSHRVPSNQMLMSPYMLTKPLGPYAEGEMMKLSCDEIPGTLIEVQKVHWKNDEGDDLGPEATNYFKQVADGKMKLEVKATTYAFAEEETANEFAGCELKERKDLDVSRGGLAG